MSIAWSCEDEEIHFFKTIGGTGLEFFKNCIASKTADLPSYVSNFVSELGLE